MTAVLPAPVRTPAPAPCRNLLAVLGDALVLCAEHEDADPHGGTRAGQAVLALAALAHRASAALGIDPGVPLSGGPGVVVVRDRSSATGLLIRAVGTTGGPSDAVAEQLLDRLRRGLTPDP